MTVILWIIGGLALWQWILGVRTDPAHVADRKRKAVEGERVEAEAVENMARPPLMSVESANRPLDALPPGGPAGSLIYTSPYITTRPDKDSSLLVFGFPQPDER